MNLKTIPFGQTLLLSLIIHYIKIEICHAYIESVFQFRHPDLEEVDNGHLNDNNNTENHTQDRYGF